MPLRSFSCLGEADGFWAGMTAARANVRPINNNNFLEILIFRLGRKSEMLPFLVAKLHQSVVTARADSSLILWRRMFYHGFFAGFASFAWSKNKVSPKAAKAAEERREEGLHQASQDP